MKLWRNKKDVNAYTVCSCGRMMKEKCFLPLARNTFFLVKKVNIFFMEGLIFLNGYDIMYRTKGAECEKALPWEERL